MDAEWLVVIGVIIGASIAMTWLHRWDGDLPGRPAAKVSGSEWTPSSTPFGEPARLRRRLGG
jgi:hypothetical protein